jgi:hypothetical protein
MTEYVIPSFEQFQKLREQRRADRQRDETFEIAAKPDERENTSHGTTTRTSQPTRPLQIYLSQLISLENETIKRARSNDGDEESTSQSEGLHNLRPVPVGQTDAKTSANIQQVGVGSHNDDDDLTRTPVHKRRRSPLTATSPDESTLYSPLFPAHKAQRTTSATPDTSNRGRVAALEIADSAKTGLSLLPTGSIRCPTDEDDPDDHKQLRGRRRQPWFQKRKKPKMKQMKISFSSSS